MGAIIIIDWSPLSLPGLIAWYDASAANSVEHNGVPALDGETATKWKDQSGHAYDVTSSPGTIVIGKGGSSMQVLMSEVIITNTALTSTERTNLDNYAKAKWGL